MNIESLKKANQLLNDLKEAKLNEDKNKDAEMEAMKMMMQMQGQESIIEAIKENRLTKEDIKEALSELKIEPQINVNVPEIKVPEIKIPEIKSPIIPEIKIPEIKIPDIKIPKIEIPKIPEIKIPEIKVPKIEMPDKMTVDGEVELKGFGMDNPLPVQLRDAKGKPMEFNFGGGGGSGGSNNRGMLKDIIDNTTVGVVCPENSSTTPLGIGGVFTGTAVDTTDYVTVNVIVKSDVASATDGFSLQFSSDGTNWDFIEPHTIVGGTGLAHLSRAKAKWFRVVYTNGGTAQTYFRLATILKNTSVSHTFERLSMNIDDNHDAAVVRAVIAGKKPNGDYVNIQATTAGNLKISVEETEALADTPEFFEDTSFVTGDSPVTLDLNAALGRNATKGYIINDGVGNFTVAFSTDGTTFGDAITMKKSEVLNFENISVDSLKLTWVADSSYRVSAI